MRRLALVVVACAVCACWAPAAGLADGPGAEPQWTVTAVSAPTNFKPGDVTGEDQYQITVVNTGDAASSGPVTIGDQLPEGLRLDRVGASGSDYAIRSGLSAPTRTPLACEGSVCTYSGIVIPGEALRMTVPVDVEAAAGSVLTNFVDVSGGGALDAPMSTPTTISESPAGFGLAPGSVTTSLSSSQAGAHADLTTSLQFNTVDDEGRLAQRPKEVVDDLPPGFAGDLVDMPACPISVFSLNECPAGTQVGVMTLLINRGISGLEVVSTPVYNLAPEPGQVAKIGFLAVVFHVQGFVTVRPGDYGLRTVFEDILESAAELDGTILTIWGVPADPVNDPWRWTLTPGVQFSGHFGASSPDARVPYLSNPTSCSGTPLQAVLNVRSWEEPANVVSAQTPFGPLFGCDRLTMPSTFSVQPTTSLAYAPTGLNAELGVHQTYENAEGLASAHLEKAVVTLPEGMTVNPSAGAGLGACTVDQYEQYRTDPAERTGEVPGEGCPNDSKLGSVRIQAPAIKEEALGSVYLATPYANPFSEPAHPGGSLLALYVVARIPNRGVIVTAAGEVKADPLTGRLTTVFDTTDPARPHTGLPQLPFTTFTLSFRQGETSPLVSPPACGQYTATARLTPWSDSSQILTVESPLFEILHGFDGGSCPAGGVPPFAPEVIAGTLDNNAGSYSPLDLRIVRGDGEQEITGFTSHLPPGLTANLTGVPFCGEAQIALARTKTGAQEEADPSCPAASQIGHTLVGVGVGSVLAYAPGKMYMGGPFEGAPFSIVAVTSAKVGPFDLGTVVVHLPLQIDPITAAVSVPAGAADQIPHIVDGIVVHVRDIRVYIDRASFTINPTSCNPMAFSATVVGSGASFTNPSDDQAVTVTDPFQESNCARLAFKPLFQVSTNGRTSRRSGASLSVKLTYPNAAQGTQANIAQVKVSLPRQLPSRLPTLQHACPARVFGVDPAGCPAASIVGHATATTPILPVALAGPAYFVSYGGAQFPELVIVLQGDGVTLDLHGETFIDEKTNITSSTFHTVPDAPIGSFELTLPQGPGSALAATANLCALTKTVLVKKRVTARVNGRAKRLTRMVRRRVAATLTMPTVFTAQNGATISQDTPISVSGCPKARKARTAGRGKEVRGNRKS